LAFKWVTGRVFFVGRCVGLGGRGFGLVTRAKVFMTRALVFAVSLLFVGVCGSGCQLIGIAANAMPPKTIDPVYYGLAGNSVSVMVWADRSIKIDFQNICLDTSRQIQNKLLEAQHVSKNKMVSLKDATWPIDPRSVARYQQDHPESEALPLTQVAPVLGTKRVIFVEISDFQTRSDASLDLFRGVATASLKVVEVNGDSAKVVYEESNIRSTVPKKPIEGVPNSTDYKTYILTVDDLAMRITDRFVPHPEEVDY
jgi:hypothetical protein